MPKPLSVGMKTIEIITIEVDWDKLDPGIEPDFSVEANLITEYIQEFAGCKVIDWESNDANY